MRAVGLFFCLSLLPVAAAPVYEQMYGGPGPNTATDANFVAAGNTAYESFGFEVSFNVNQQARINALTGPNNFTFNVARVSSPWTNGRTYNFVQKYSGDDTKLINIEIIDTVSNLSFVIPEYTATFGNVQNLIVRMVAPDPDPTGNTARPTSGSLSFNNWQLQGQSISGMPGPLTLSTFDNPQVNDIRLINYFRIGGIDFTQAWTLTGSFTMAWDGSTNPASNPNPNPGNNDLAFQIKAYQLDLSEVPEPSTYAMIGAGLLCLAFFSRKNTL